MAEDIISLGCDSDSEIAFDEDILRYLREEWGETLVASQSAFDEGIDFLLSIDNEGLVEPDLFNVCEEVIDMSEFMDSEDEEWLLAGARKSDQQGANPLFSVTRQRLGAPRQWQNGKVLQDRLRLQLQQNRYPHGDMLGEAVAEACYQAIREYLLQERINPSHYKLQMKIHHNTGGKTAWTSSPLLPVED